MKQRITSPSFRAKGLQSLRVSGAMGAPCLGRLSAGSITIPCSIGRNGLTRFKREGDGKTPVGRFALRGGYIQRENFRMASAVKLKLKQLKAQDGWCDDATSANYNRPVSLPNPASHEILKRPDGIYDLILVLDYNLRPRIKGRGSAIFFHLTRQRGEATAGCVAISREDMRRLLPRLTRKTRLLIT
jgi:L,D-peptidoglycan transpeptidase YkuD (ErfK/YbiS/YcfS/YnhG family)